MKLSYFRLQARPFPTTPDPQFYYAATPHETALDRLQRALDDGEGIVLLTGAAGTGKTLLAHRLLGCLGPELNAALITNCRFASRSDLLRALLFDLGQSPAAGGEQELRQTLTAHLLDAFAQHRRSVLVLDEAQGLSADLLEELRLLSNLEAGPAKAVQIVLIAQPAILQTLALPELAVLDQRLAVRVELEALDMHESADYLLHQLRQAGGRPERLLTDEAVAILARTGRGVPRLLNRYAYQALALAEQAGAERVDAEVVLEALGQLGIEPEPAEEEFPTRPTLAVPSDVKRSAEPLLTTHAGPTPATGKRPLASSESPWIAGGGFAAGEAGAVVEP